MEQGSEAYRSAAKQQSDQDYERKYKDAASKVAQQQADTMESYRRDQARRMEEESRIGKLKLLMGGGATGPDGKPLTNEAQKTSNLIDTARESLNNNETFSKEHPIASSLATLPLSGFFGKIIGGPLKEATDNRSIAKEAMQNVYTGAAASGEQVPAFQSFAGPGIMDILSGKTAPNANVSDSLNSLQQGYQRQSRTLTPEAAAQNRLNQRLQKMAPQDRALYQEITANPNHPNAASARKDLERKYGTFR